MPRNTSPKPISDLQVFIVGNSSVFDSVWTSQNEAVGRCDDLNNAEGGVPLIFTVKPCILNPSPAE